MKNKRKEKQLSMFIASFYKMLRAEKGCSDNTLSTYSYTFVLFFKYFKEVKEINFKDLTLKDFTKKNVLGFYDWLENERGNSICSRNNRRAAISSLAQFIAQEEPEYMHQCLEITEIKRKKEDVKTVCHASVNGLRLILSSIKVDTIDGIRDRVMLTVLSVTGIRVSELINIKICDVSFGYNSSILVHGKGNKDRLVYLPNKATSLILDFLKVTKRDSSIYVNEWLFTNHKGEQLTRFGINYLVKKYVKLAHKINPSLIPENFSTHKFRHSFAMAQIEAGTGIFEIKELLGHSHVTTTQTYAKTASSKKKKEAIEKVEKMIENGTEKPLWIENDNVREFINNLKKQKNYVE